MARCPLALRSVFVAFVAFSVAGFVQAAPDSYPDFTGPRIFGALFGLAIFLAVVVGLFLLLRAVVLWYWKLDRIERHLAALVTHFTGRPPL